MIPKVGVYCHAEGSQGFTLIDPLCPCGSHGTVWMGEDGPPKCIECGRAFPMIELDADNNPIPED